MSEKGSDPDIEARRFNVAEVPENDTRHALFLGQARLHEIDGVALHEATKRKSEHFYFVKTI
jgi:hypothetical protein